MYAKKSKAKRWLIQVVGLVLVVVLGGGLWLYTSSQDSKQASHATAANQQTEYLNFSGNYVFSVPQSYMVDDWSAPVPGMILAYPQGLKVKTLDEAYAADTVTVQYIAPLADQKASTFKKYVNDTIMTDIKKNLSADASLQFASSGARDTARITVTKDSKPVRFVYVKNGRQPMVIMGKAETPEFKKVAETIAEVENSDLKTDIDPLKKAVLHIVQLVKDKKASELYSQSTADLTSQSSQAQFGNALETAAPYTKGTILINGMTYKLSAGEFTAIMGFAPVTQGAQPTSGVLTIQKTNGAWKLKTLTLPSPGSDASSKPAQ